MSEEKTSEVEKLAGIINFFVKMAMWVVGIWFGLVGLYLAVIIVLLLYGSFVH